MFRQTISHGPSDGCPRAWAPPSSGPAVTPPGVQGRAFSIPVPTPAPPDPQAWPSTTHQAAHSLWSFCSGQLALPGDKPEQPTDPGRGRVRPSPEPRTAAAEGPGPGGGRYLPPCPRRSPRPARLPGAPHAGWCAGWFSVRGGARGLARPRPLPQTLWHPWVLAPTSGPSHCQGSTGPSSPDVTGLPPARPGLCLNCLREALPTCQPPRALLSPAPSGRSAQEAGPGPCGV